MAKIDHIDNTENVWSTIPLNKKRKPTSKEYFCCFPLTESLVLLFKWVIPPIIYLVSDVFDLTSDIAVAIQLHKENGLNWHFGLTVAFILAPSLLFAMYAVCEALFNTSLKWASKIQRIALYSVAIFTISLWPIVSYIKMIYYGLKALLNSNKRLEYLETIEEMRSSGDLITQQMLRAFVESAPQLLLQLYLLMIKPPQDQNSLTAIIQLVSIFFSLFSLTSTVIQFQNEGERERQISEGKELNQTCCSLTEYLWWFLSITARVIALSLFASVFKLWVFAVCFGHVLIMAVCILINQPQKGCKEAVVAVWVGIIYIFCFVEYKGNFNKIGKIISLYILYYMFTLPQNAAMVLSSFFLTGAKYDYHFPLVIFHFVASSLSLIFMLCYLGLLRPFLRFKATTRVEYV